MENIQENETVQPNNAQINECVCTNCNTVFDANWKLERHKKNKKGCKVKPEDFKCTNCNKKFSSKSNLIRHQKKYCVNEAQEDQPVNTAANPDNSIKNDLLEDFFKVVSPNPELVTKFMKFLYIEQNRLIDELKNDKKNLEDRLNNIGVPTQIHARQSSNNNQIPNVDNGNGVIPNVQVNVQNQNVQNNIVQNNVINNNLILPPVINPFGYEDISHISDVEKLRILTSPNGLELGLKLLYNKVSNRNFYRPNANKDNIAVLDTDLKVQIKDKKSFNDDMLEKGIVVMYRLLDSCKTKLSFKDKLMIEQNITRNRDMLRFDNYIRCVLNLIETCLQDNVSKEIFKKFSDKLSREETFRKEKLKLIKQLIDELKKFNTEFNNVSISDEYLKSEVWCIDESRNDAMDPHDVRNNLEHNYIENTIRYKMLEKMKEEEHMYFEEHGITLGDLRKYRMIQLDRARQEIDLMNEIYKDEMLKEELENKLLNKNTDNFDSNLSHIKFIDEANMLDI